MSKKVLISNFLSLSVLQVFSYALPLLTLPYLVKVLTPSYYGLISFSQSIAVFLFIIVDFGFNFSAVRQIASYQNNIKKLIEIFSSVMLIKTILLLFSFFLLVLIITIFQKFEENKYVYFLSFLYVVGQAYFPSWFFQGIEKMKFITFINVCIKISFTLLIFIFVKTEQDFYLVPIFNGIGFCIAAIVAIYIIRLKFKISFEFQKIKTILVYFFDSWKYFLSNISVNLYSNANTFFLGLVTTNTIVGYYSMAEQLYKAMVAFFGPISTALYPYMTRTKDISLYRKILLYIFVLCFFILMGLLYLDDFILTLFYRIEINILVIRLFDLFSFLFIIATISCMLGYPFLGALGYVEEANNSIIFGAVLHMISILFLYVTYSISPINIMIATLITEIFILVYRVFYSYKLVYKERF
ncbi:oligosaccharide flippase family protein [Gallibacterium anatis]|uniref:Uncharacterized protein n=3 Tax=Gallibacterium anatis TaxID=750 RepID=U1H3D8_9PAST|nr:oligosaccharide flippase family protein [Gallibacterium anatis]ERF78951.1 hypothetical protein N561_03465 [Gallibacterium anatis 12656/12]KGQ47649.1 hypothetical protein JL04_09685 [Gallibacterium anatis]KGQ65400.1 hypothetical protein IO43_02525 [Gallibacterium anatis 7990]